VAVRGYASVRAGGGPLSVGDVLADAFTVVSQFSAYVCEKCGYTEFYRRLG
jgi:predicted nucleic-acid-binding Zn-ribbon protein